MYHLVTDEEVAHTRYLYRHRSTHQFEADLDILLKIFTPITMGALLDQINRGIPLPSNAMFLSFDDGLREQVEVVAPILSRKGVPATFFITRDFVNNKTLFYRFKASLLIDAFNSLDELRRAQVGACLGLPQTGRQHCLDAILRVNYRSRFLLDELAEIIDLNFGEYLSEKRPFMTMDEISSLIANGFTIGAHSVDHPHYREIALHEQLRQTRESTDFIHNTFASTYTAFAFPFSNEGVNRA
ncbi:polysaccharide deacetylase family protein, partial [Pseudomonadota bacterium]